jgi:hypothetical protein
VIMNDTWQVQQGDALEQPRLLSVAPYVYEEPPRYVFAFRCRCGRCHALLRYGKGLDGYINMWAGNSFGGGRYCPDCGTHLISGFLEQFVRYARDKHHRRGIRFWGLKEEEAREEALDRIARREGMGSYYRPTNPAFLEGGH